MPEIVIRGASRAQVLEALTHEMIENEFALVLANPSVVVFEKSCADFDTAFFYGKGWNTSADMRVTCCFVDDPSGLHVKSDLEVVTHAGTVEEERANAPLGHPTAHVVQHALEQVKGTVALQRHAEAWPESVGPDPEPPTWTGNEH